MKAQAERATWAGHGKPAEFLFLGTAKNPDEDMRDGMLATAHKEADGSISIISGSAGYSVSPNTKFWAVAKDDGVERTQVEVDGLQPMVEKLNAKVDLLASANETYKAQLQEAKDLAEGFAAREAALVAHVKELEDAALFSAPTEPSPSWTEVQGTEIVSVPAEELDGLLEALEAAGKSATVKMEAIRKNRKASYADRLHCKFLEGTAKTAAWVLEEFGKLDEF